VNCDQELYGHGRCVLPAGHDARDPLAEHQAADGTRWVHRVELLGRDCDSGGEAWEDWDEPVGGGDS
jgi:hypothetical protein